MKAMTVQITCSKCHSSIHIYPNESAKIAVCDICQNEENIHFTKGHEENQLKTCALCERQDFYVQKDFNRKLGVSLFVCAALLSTALLWVGAHPIWYLSVFVLLYAADFFLFRRLDLIAICYKCQTIYRNVKNIDELDGFDHEMNDRIIYANHDFKGQRINKD